MTSNVAITEKNEEEYARLQLIIPGAFTDKVIPNIDGFTDELLVQCDLQVVGNTFVDYSK